jgi:lysozyme
MNLKPEMLKMLKHHEGVRFKPYLCPAVIWTVGVGRVLYQEQIKLPVVRKEGYTGIIRKEFKLRGEDNRVWTQEEVDALLDEDIVRFTRGVARLVNDRASDSQFSAMVSFAFNAGLGALQRSTIRMKHNRKDYQGAAEAFMMWTKGGRKVLPGLVKRRIDEKNLYLQGLVA